jgi:DNA-binding MarR family transcriptional regulator
LNQAEYMALAEFRYQLRRFLRNMEEKSRDEGLNPQQYQLLLAIKGLPRQQSPTISALAERMQLNHNSTVELVDRCEERGLVSRLRTGSDRRHVTLSITPEGDVRLQRLATAARQELRSIGPVLVESIQGLIQAGKARRPGGADSKKKPGAKKTGP